MLQLKSLRLKLIVCFLMLILVPLAAMGLYGHFFTRSALSEQALERSMHEVHLQADSIASALRQVQGDALYLSAIRSLDMLRRQTEPEQIDLWKHEVAQDLLVLASVRPMYYSLRLINLEGEEFIGVRTENDQVSIITNLQDRADSLYFQETLALPTGGIYVSPFQPQDAVGVPYIHYTVRLPDAVLVVDLHAGWLLRALPDHPSADTWALIDQDGRFLVYPENFDPEQVKDDVSAILNAGAGNFETSSSVYVYDTIELTSSAGVTGENAPFWLIFRHTPTHVLYASVNKFYLLALIFMTGAVALAVIFALLISSVLVKPVKRLAQMAEHFGQEGTAPPLPERLSNDEIGELTRVFHETARELEGKRRQEHRLIERLIHAQEEERKLVAYDLHDGLIQQMVGARFYLTSCRAVCPHTDIDARGGIQRGCDALTEAIVEGRRIIEGLRPATLDDLGLTAAIEEIAQGTAAAAGWELELDLPPLPREPEKTIAVTLYRIAQEALNNARKHAGARHVKVSLHNGSGIHLEIADDGSGFDLAVQTVEGRGLGITTMQERASLIDGTCVIHSEAGKGTRIAVVVPQTLSIKEAQEIGSAL